MQANTSLNNRFHSFNISFYWMTKNAPSGNQNTKHIFNCPSSSRKPIIKNLLLLYGLCNHDSRGKISSPRRKYGSFSFTPGILLGFGISNLFFRSLYPFSIVSKLHCLCKAILRVANSKQYDAKKSFIAII